MRLRSIYITLLSGWLIVGACLHSSSNRQAPGADYKEAFQTLTEQGRGLMQRGQADSLLVVCQQMMRIAQLAHNDSLLAESYISIGGAFNLKTDFENSLNFFLKGLHLAEEHDMTDPAMRALVDLGSLYEDMENYAEARKYIQRALVKLPRSAKQVEASIYLNGNMALIDIMTGKPEQAKPFLARAREAYLAYSRTGGDPYSASFLKWLDAMIIERSSTTANADSAYRAAAEYSRVFSVQVTRGQILNSYARFLHHNKKNEQAKIISREAVDVALTTGYATDAIKAASMLSRLYDDQHRPDSANHYYRLKDSLQATVYDTQRLNRLQDIAFTEQIRQQEEDARVEELALKRRNNLQYAGITVGLISVIVIFLLFSRRGARRPGLVEFLGVIGLLIFFEFVNLLLHPLLGRFTHESPALMLLLMVILAALLVPLHHRMETLVKSKAGRKQRNR